MTTRAHAWTWSDHVCVANWKMAQARNAIAQAIGDALLGVWG